MTTPQPGQPLPGQVQSWKHDAALLAIESATAGLISAGLVGRLRELLTRATETWVALFGSVAAKPASLDRARPVVDLVHSVLDQLSGDVPDALRPAGDGIRAAYVLGLKQAGAPRLAPERLNAYAAPKLFMPYSVTAPAVVRQIAGLIHYPDTPTADQLLPERERRRIADAVASELEQAKELLNGSQLTEKGFTQVQVAIARAGKIQQRIDSAVSWHLLNANQQAVMDTAMRRGLELIWVSERDACVVCLALNGDVVDPGETFDVNATYGDADKVPPVWPEEDTLLHPPRHNNCRCRCEIHDSATDQGFADALKRESDRAIAYGWRTDTESPEVRRDAAERLLAAGVKLPKTVLERSRRAIKSQTMFGGPVPDGR